MATVEQTSQTSTSSRQHSAVTRRGDFLLTQGSPTLYWEGESINVSALLRTIREGLRERYGEASTFTLLRRAAREIWETRHQDIIAEPPATT